MKRLVLIMLFFPIALYSQVIMQKGHVRKISYSKNTIDAPVANVRVKVETEERSDVNGNFVLKVPLNPDKTFVFTQVYRDGYVLISPSLADIRRKKYALNPQIEVEIIVADANNLELEKLRIVDNIRKEKENEILNLKELVKQKENALAQLKDVDFQYKQIKHKRDSIDEVLHKFIQNYYNSIDAITEEADKLALIDYKTLDSIEIVNVELKKAGKGKELVAFNKRLLPKNDISLTKNVVYDLKKGIEYIAVLSKIYRGIAEGYGIQYENDSALVYWRKRVYIDPTNYDYAIEYAQFINNRMRQFNEAIEFYSKAFKLASNDYDKAIIQNELGILKSKQGFPFIDISESYTNALDLLLKKDTLGLSKNRDVISIFFNIGNFQKEMHCYADAEKSYLLGINSIRNIIKLANDYHDKLFLAQKLTALGCLRMEMRKFELAEENLMNAFDIFKTIHSNDSLNFQADFIDNLNCIGRLNLKRNKTAIAEPYFIEAMNKSRACLKLDSLKYLSVLATSLNNTGQCKVQLNDFEFAEKCFSESLSIVKKLTETHTKTYDFQLSTILNDYAHLKSKLNKQDLAEQYILSSLNIRRELAQKKPEVYNVFIVEELNELSKLYIQNNQYQRAEVALLESLSLCYNLKFDWTNDYDSELFETYRLLSDLSVKCENIKDAKIYLNEALTYCNALLKKGFNEYESDNAEIVQKLNHIQNSQGTAGETVKIDDHNSIDFSEWIGNLSYFLIMEQKYSEAEYFAVKALKQSPTQSWINTNLALSLLLQGKFQDAKQIYLELKEQKYPLEMDKTFKDIFLMDLDELEAKGISHPYMIKIRSILED